MVFGLKPIKIYKSLKAQAAFKQLQVSRFRAQEFFNLMLALLWEISYIIIIKGVNYEYKRS